MTHASVELVEAVAGVGGSRAGNYRQAPCGFNNVGAGMMVFAWVGGNDTWECDEDVREVTCPRCLVAMDAAREGMILTPTQSATTHPPQSG